MKKNSETNCTYELFLGLNEDTNSDLYFYTVEKDNVNVFIIKEAPENSRVYMENLISVNSIELFGTTTTTIYIPKKVAEIKLCGAITYNITEVDNFIKPTPEQIKNLHDILCIDVKLFD